MGKRLSKERVREVLKSYEETRNAENPDTMIFCLIALEDGVITKEQAKKIYEYYSINNIVKARQYIQNSEKMFTPDYETMKKKHVGNTSFRHAWRKGKPDV